MLSCFFFGRKPIGFVQVVSGEQEGFSSGSVLEPKMPKRVIHCSQARWHTQHARHLHPILPFAKVKAPLGYVASRERWGHHWPPQSCVQDPEFQSGSELETVTIRCNHGYTKIENNMSKIPNMFFYLRRKTSPKITIDKLIMTFRMRLTLTGAYSRTASGIVDGSGNMRGTGDFEGKVSSRKSMEAYGIIFR